MKATLVDYGVGNIHSLRKAIEATGRDCHVTQDPKDLDGAELVILPGVGAFGHVMEALAPMADALRARHAAGRPILGICIGMQVLYEGSDEAPGTPGLAVIPGHVHALKAPGQKIPHMGWNTLDEAQGPLAAAQGDHVYYVHSFAAPVGPGTLATTHYGDPFAAAVQSGKTLGLQFHPEKSSTVGKAILDACLTTLETP